MDSVLRARLTLILFVLLPFVVLVGTIIHEGQRATMFLFGIVILGAFIKNVWLRLFIWYWVLWLALMGIMMTLGKFPYQWTQAAYVKSCYMILAFAFFFAIQESKIKKETIYNAICITAILQAVLGIMQMWGLDPVFFTMALFANVVKNLPENEVTGALGNNNFLAVYLAIATPFFYRRYWAYFVPVLVAVILCALTSTATAALMIGSVVFFYKKVKLRWMLLAAIPFIIYLCMIKASLTYKFTFDHDRFQWWFSAYTFWKQSWGSILFGFGPTITWGRPFPLHNEWVTALFNFGAVGFAIVLGYFLTAYRKNKILYSAFITAAVAACGTYPLHLAPSVTLLMIIMGLMEREKWNETEKHETAEKEKSGPKTEETRALEIRGLPCMTKPIL